MKICAVLCVVFQRWLTFPDFKWHYIVRGMLFSIPETALVFETRWSSA